MKRNSVTFLVRQKFRFDMGQGFLAILNFAFVIIAGSDKLATLIALPTKVVILILVPLSVGLVWLMGYLLDKAKFLDAYQDELNQRNAMLKSINDRSEDEGEREQGG